MKWLRNVPFRRFGFSSKELVAIATLMERVVHANRLPLRGAKARLDFGRVGNPRLYGGCAGHHGGIEGCGGSSQG